MNYWSEEGLCGSWPMKCKHGQEWSRFIGGWNQVVIWSWTLCSAWRAAQFKRFIFTHSRASPWDIITQRGGNWIPWWDILNALFIITAMLYYAGGPLMLYYAGGPLIQYLAFKTAPIMAEVHKSTKFYANEYTFEHRLIVNKVCTLF